MRLSLKQFIAITVLICFPVETLLAAPIVGHIKIDNFGYRTGDYKIAYFTSNPGTTVGIYNASTSTLAYSVPAANITSQGTDATGITGDTVWWEMCIRDRPGHGHLDSNPIGVYGLADRNSGPEFE